MSSVFARRLVGFAKGGAAGGATGAIGFGAAAVTSDHPSSQSEQRFPERVARSADINDPDGIYEVGSAPKLTHTGFSPAIDAARETLLEESDFMVGVIQQHPQAPQSREACMNILRRFSMDENYAQKVHRKVEQKLKQMTVAKLEYTDLQRTAEEMWAQLRREYPCTICQDVFAAPVALSGCGHSLCGMCWKDLTESCVDCEGRKGRVVHECPQCRTEVADAIFVRVLDQKILAEVEKVPDCVEKRDFMERREQYLQVMKEEEQRKAEMKAQFTARFRLNSPALARPARPEPATEDGGIDEERRYHMLGKWLVANVVVLVFTLVNQYFQSNA